MKIKCKTKSPTINFEDVDVGEMFAPVETPKVLCLKIPVAISDDTNEVVDAVELESGEFIDFDYDEQVITYPKAEIIY